MIAGLAIDDITFVALGIQFRWEAMSGGCAHHSIRAKMSKHNNKCREVTRSKSVDMLDVRKILQFLLVLVCWHTHDKLKAKYMLNDYLIAHLLAWMCKCAPISILDQ